MKDLVNLEDLMEEVKEREDFKSLLIFSHLMFFYSTSSPFSSESHALVGRLSLV